MARNDVANDSFRTELAFLNQKVELHGQAERAAPRGFEKQTSHAEIVKARKILASITLPVDPDGLMRIRGNTGIEASGRDSCSLQH